MVVLFSISQVRADLWINHLGGVSVRGVAYDRERGLLWIATENEGAFSFNGVDFIRYNVITTKGGLPSNGLTSVLVNREGEIWFGTLLDGVVRFQPEQNEWTAYTVEQGLGLASNNVLSLAADTLGNILAGTSNAGASYWDRSTDKWTTYNSGNGLRGNEVLAVAIDRHLNKWFGVKSGGVSVLTRELQWCHFLAGASGYAIHLERAAGSEIKWFGMGNGAVYRLAEVGSFCSSIPERIATVRGTVQAIWADAGNSQWFALTTGAVRRDALGQLREFNDPDNLNFRSVKAIVRDDDGNLWFGLSFAQGLVQYRANWVTFSGEKDGLPTNSASALAEDRNGKIWAGTVTHLFSLQGLKWQSHAIFDQDSTTIQNLTAIAFDELGNMWLGTISSGVVFFAASDTTLARPIFYNDSNGLAHNTVNDVAASAGRIWFATQNGLSLWQTEAQHWTTFDTTNSGLIENHTLAVAVETGGAVWCGTVAGVSRYDPVTSDWQNFTTQNGLAGDYVNDIAFDPRNGNVWFATEGFGVSDYDPAVRRWITWTDINGLGSNFVKAIALHPLFPGTWFGTANGASFWDTNGVLYNYTAQHGLGENRVTAVLWDQRDQLWFGSTLRGITRYQRQSQKPRIRLSQRFDVVTGSTVIYDFIGSDFSTPASLLRYVYRVSGMTNYTQFTTDNFARLVLPENGAYEFAVKCFDSDGNESAEAVDTFFKIPSDTGKVTSFEFPEGFRSLKPVRVDLYWPPHLLEENTQISLQPVSADSLPAAGLLAFDLNIEEGRVDTLPRPVTLAFSFPLSSNMRKDSLAIYRERPGLVRLGGTVTSKHGTVTISVPIRKLGRYAVRIETASSSNLVQESAAFSAQPRIFSPNGRGHGTETTLSFQLHRSGTVKIKVYNLAGRLVRIVWDQHLNAGLNAVAWNGRDEDNRICPSGLYIMTIEGGGFDKQLDPVKVVVLNE